MMASMGGLIQLANPSNCLYPQPWREFKAQHLNAHCAHNRRSIYTAIVMMGPTVINTPTLLRHPLRSFVSRFPGTSTNSLVLFFCDILYLLSFGTIEFNWTRLHLPLYCMATQQILYVRHVHISNLIYPLTFVNIASNCVNIRTRETGFLISSSPHGSRWKLLPGAISSKYSFLCPPNHQTS